VWVERRGEVLPRGLRAVDRFPVAAWAVSIAAFLVATKILNDTSLAITRMEPWQAHALYGIFAVSLVTPAALGTQTRGLVRRLLANRVLLYLGLVSYGIFLWHLPVIQQLVDSHLERVGFIHPYLLWTLTTLVISTAIASVSYYVLERPAMGLRRKILGSRKADSPRGEALAEPAPVGPLAAPRESP
jgi:peptidoglycan/LPS O-acetylase OafA/YrhL